MTEDNKSTRVLVTGGGGFIGSHVCKRLAGRGFTPVTFDNLSSGHAWAVKWGPLIEGDLRTARDLDEAFRRCRPAAVIHLAAHIDINESMNDPEEHYRNNVAGTLELLSAMRRWNVDRLVFASSCAVYGEPERQPIAEDEAPAPVNTYGRAKLMCERLIGDFADVYGMRAISLRFFNACGASPEDGIGEARPHETHLIPLALEALLRGEAVTVHGDDYDTDDGTCIRDYVHVGDIADAHLQAMRALDDLPAGRAEAYNLSNGRGHSVLQVLDAVERVTGRTLVRRTGPRRTGDVPVLVGDAGRAAERLGWRTRQPDIDAIVRSAWTWHRRHASAGRPERVTE